MAVRYPVLRRLRGHTGTFEEHEYDVQLDACATKAVLLHQLGRHAEAADAYRAALALTDNAVEQDFLTERVTARER